MLFRASRFTWRRVDELLGVGIMRCRWWRRLDDGAEDGVKMVRKLMTAGVDVNGRGEAFNIQSLFYAPSNPVLFRGEDGHVLFAEMVAVIARMLEHGRLVFAKGIDGGGRMVVETG